MDGGIPIGRVLGIRVYLHPTWFVVFFLVTITLFIFGGVAVMEK